ncbi:MAG TPA: hypothetical protein PK253_12280 [Spirochaetota bacterium]|mgnify:CR=1 FL=1|nr:hypothetical protein [Spirochaetota bacterium]HPQ54018.1 hypothetical protein [Spirochaetota bacterium]
MNKATIRSNSINLPPGAVKKLGGGDVEIIETEEGVLLRPVGTAVKNARGFLKGKGTFSSEKFMSRKREEKEYE